MTNCPSSEKLEAYYDDELAGEARLAIERHLSECAQCEAALARLRAISSAFGAEEPKLSQISRHRLHLKVDQLLTEGRTIERGLARIAWMLSGMAASVLLIGSAWLARAKDAPQAAPPPWVGVASLTSDTTDASARDAAATPAAEWYLASDTSRGSDELQ